MFSCSLLTPGISIWHKHTWISHDFDRSSVLNIYFHACMHRLKQEQLGSTSMATHISWAKLLPCHTSMPSVLLYAWDLALSAWFGSHINCELEGMTGQIMVGMIVEKHRTRKSLNGPLLIECHLSIPSHPGPFSFTIRWVTSRTWWESVGHATKDWKRISSFGPRAFDDFNI